MRPDRRDLLTIAALSVIVVAGGLFAYARLRSPAYTNPVLAHDAPDPSVIRAEDGFFYAYTTQSDWPTLKNIPILRSPDLVRWRYVADAFPTKPRWVTTDMWAPHIHRVDDRYLLYYSARRFGSAGFAIGVASAPTPTGPFRDRGRPLLTGPRFTTIDPFVYTTPEGHHLIYWGSNSAPIRVQELSADGMDVVGRPKPVLFPDEDNEYESLVEGPWLVRRGGFYYLMYSGDACCEPDPHYAVLVARSRSPRGPFTKYEGNPILEANQHFYGPGHNATIRDSDGRDWILYHAFERGDVTAIRQLLLDPIDWDGGWPSINDGDGPARESSVAPAVD